MSGGLPIPESLEGALQLGGVTLLLGSLPVVPESKGQPILVSQMHAEIVAFDKIEHAKKLVPLRPDHVGNQVLNVIKAGDAEIRAENLAQAPRSAGERRLAIEVDGFRQAVILVRAPCAIAASLRVRDVRVARVEATAGSPVEQVTLKQNFRTAIVQVAGSGAFDLDDGPHRGAGYPDSSRGFVECFLRQRLARSGEFHAALPLTPQGISSVVGSKSAGYCRDAPAWPSARRTRPATARILPGEARQIAAADTAAPPSEIQKAGV